MSHVTRNDTFTHTLVGTILVTSRGDGWQASITVSDGMNHATGRHLRGVFPTQALAWQNAVAEGNRILDRIIEAHHLEFVGPADVFES